MPANDTLAAARQTNPQADTPTPPIVGLAIAAPARSELPRFIHFMEEVLAPGGINTLVLRVDYNYTYESRPELRNENPLRRDEVKQLVASARKLGIELIPQINLLGHQSWHSHMEKLLVHYPQFDENPSVKLPEKYEWPNADGLYCKSYCPLHPEVHKVVFDLVDEIMEVFEARAFHAGMDEVFYIAEDECPRCKGRDPAELFAQEVSRIRGHLAENGHKLWIWGDRLLDGHATGLGMWEASENGTHRAIDMIPKDVVICDWHYERADPTAVIFATKGFRVLTCPWRNPDVTRTQAEMLAGFKAQSVPELSKRYAGMLQTVWSSAKAFMDLYESNDPAADGWGQVESLQVLFETYGPSE